MDDVWQFFAFWLPAGLILLLVTIMAYVATLLLSERMARRYDEERYKPKKAETPRGE